MLNRAIRTIFVLTFALVMFFAWWTYAAHAMCFENQLGDTCFYLNQSERAAQIAQSNQETDKSRQDASASKGESLSVWPPEEVQCRRERDLHERLDRWASAADREKKWPATPWCEKYERGNQ